MARDVLHNLPMIAMGAEPHGAGSPAALLVLFFSSILLCAAMGFAQKPGKKVEGVVVRVSGDEVVVDIGRSSGAAEGMDVEFYRKVVIKHPVTGKKVEDRFFIGKDEIKQAGELLSLVVIKSSFTHKPMEGDYAVLSLPIIVPLSEEEEKALKAGTGAPGACPQAKCPPTECDTEALKIHKVWLMTLGKSIEDRIAIWKIFIKSNPGTPYLKEITAQVEWYEALRKAEFQVEEQEQLAEATKIYHKPVEKIYEGMPLDIAVEVAAPEKIAKMVLHHRKKGKKYFTSATMKRSGDFNFHYLVPPEALSHPGLEYFIEVVGVDGKKRSGVGGPSLPVAVSVKRSPVKMIEKAGRSRWSTSFDYVDFYYKNNHRDYFWKLETDFLYKIKTFLYGARMGVGFFEGRGGSNSDIESSFIPDGGLEPLSFAYMFTELEFKIVKYFYVSGRFLAGTTLQGYGQEHEGEVIVGGQGRVRIGEEWAYLILGASFTKDAGVEAELSVNIDVLKKFPIAGYVLVTDLPVETEWSVRLVGQVGWRPLPWIAIGLRGGWNIRTIKHEGWSVGAATELRW
jgi:hypothetical protein